MRKKLLGFFKKLHLVIKLIFSRKYAVFLYDDSLYSKHGIIAYELYSPLPDHKVIDYSDAIFDELIATRSKEDDEHDCDEAVNFTNELIRSYNRSK